MNIQEGIRPTYRETRPKNPGGTRMTRGIFLKAGAFALGAAIIDAYLQGSITLPNLGAVVNPDIIGFYPGSVTINFQLGSVEEDGIKRIDLLPHFRTKPYIETAPSDQITYTPRLFNQGLPLETLIDNYAIRIDNPFISSGGTRVDNHEDPRGFWVRTEKLFGETAYVFIDTLTASNLIFDPLFNKDRITPISWRGLITDLETRKEIPAPETDKVSLVTKPS